MSTLPPTEIPVLISGAGPVGLSLALGLARSGVPSTVIEKKTELSPHSRALLISTRTLEIFRSCGIYEAFAAESALIEEISVWVTGHAEPSATIHLSSLARLSAVPGVIVLPQNRTEALLLDAVRATGLVDVRFGTKVVGLEPDVEGVTVSIADTNGQSSIRASFVAGCDGAHSIVREQLGLKLDGKTYPIRMLLADVRFLDARAALPWPRLAAVPDAVLAGIRFATGEWRIIASLRTGESEDSALSEASLDDRVQTLFGAGPYERVWANTFHIHNRCSPKFRTGRVVLAGDAAHLNSPAGGQGMNTGIHDAHNLAWKLVRALEGGDSDVLLGSYEQERRGAFLSTVSRFTDLLTRIGLTSPQWLRAIIVRLMALAVRLPALQAVFALRASMLTTRYADSVLFPKGCTAPVGARASDGEVSGANGGRGRLLDLTTSGAALVLFDDGGLPGWNVAEIASACAGIKRLCIVRLLAPEAQLAPDAGPSVFRANSHLWQAWKGAPGLVVLIRPDGYVGYTATRPTLPSLSAAVRLALGEKAA